MGAYMLEKQIVLALHYRVNTTEGVEIVFADDAGARARKQGELSSYVVGTILAPDEPIMPLFSFIGRMVERAEPVSEWVAYKTDEQAEQSLDEIQADIESSPDSAA